MHDNILSMEASDTVFDVESDKSPSPTEDNTQDSDHKSTMPIGVELTGYRLLTTGVILGIGVPKAVYSYKGQAVISTTLDWLVGVIFALILFWLGVIEAKRPELSPRFFQADLATPIQKFLSRREVHICFPYALALLLFTSATLDDWRDHKRRHATNIPEYDRVSKDVLVMDVLASSIGLCVFCLQCLKVIWPGVFGGTRHGVLLTKIQWLMLLALLVYMVVKIVLRREDYPTSFVKVVVGTALRVSFCTSLLFSEQLLDAPSLEGYFSLLRSKDFRMAAYLAYIVLTEAVLIGVWGFPDFPDLLDIFSSCFVVVLVLYHFFASVPTSWVPLPSFAHIWSTSKAFYDRVRSAGNEAWVFVSGNGRGM